MDVFMKAGLTLVAVMAVLILFGYAIERILPYNDNRMREDDEDDEDYEKRTTPCFMRVPAPELEARPIPYHGSIDLYQAAKIELVFYADLLAEELTLLNNANELNEE